MTDLHDRIARLRHLPGEGAKFDSEDWDLPLPLDDPHGPEFPLDALPASIRAVVDGVAEAAQVPADLAAVVALGTLSAAAGGKYVVHVRDNSWREPVHVMLVAVAEPGTRKSAVFEMLARPLTDYENMLHLDEQRDFAAWESRLRVLERQLTSTERELAKHRGSGDSLSDAEVQPLAAVNALEDHRKRKPRVTQIVADDVTMEAAKSLLFEQAGALAVMSAESAFLSMVAGRYSEGTPNLDVLLNGHAGDRIRVDRKGRPSESIDRACLSLTLMVQPDVIRDLGKIRGFVLRGGAARLLPAFPVDRLGTRKIDVQPVSEALINGWTLLVTQVARRRPKLKGQSYEPWDLQLDAKAEALIREFRMWHEPGLLQGGRYYDLRDWAAKQPGAVLRLAGLLHIAQHHDAPEAAPVEAETVRQAIAIVGYFEDHARILYRMLQGRSKHGDARVVLDALREFGTPTTRRELHRKLQDRVAFAQADDLAAPLALLNEYGYIRRERVTGQKGGRPSEVIVLNPHCGPDRTSWSPNKDDGRDGCVGSVRVLEHDESGDDHSLHAQYLKNI